MTDQRDLISRMADELDHYRQLLTDSRCEVHPLAVEARAALAADGPAVPEGREPASVIWEPSDEELLRIAAEAIDPYDKIGLGEYEAETECAVEAYGSELIAFARAVLARYGHQPAPPAAVEQRHPAPVAVAERLPELRGMFERILCVARSSGQRPVGNIQLADRLISAVVSWAALPLPTGEVE